MRGYRIIFLLLFCIALVTGGCRFALSAQKVWVIGVEDTSYYPHFDLVDGQWQGFGAVLLERFGEQSGYTFEFRPMPVERLFRSFILGELDFKYPAAPTWKLDEKKGVKIYYSNPVVDYVDGTNLLAARLGGQISQIKTLGIVRGFSPVAWADQVESREVTLILNDSFPSLVRLALRGRIDAIYANTDVIKQVSGDVSANLNANSRLVFDQSLPHDKSAYLLATLEHAEIIQEFNQWMIENSGMIDSLKVEYFGPTEP